MKSGFSLSQVSQGIKAAFVLGTVVTLGFGVMAPVEAKTAWNPVSWFSSAAEEQPSLEEQARIKAKEARQKAEAAEKAALEAEKAAEEARRLAEKTRQKETAAMTEAKAASPEASEEMQSAEAKPEKRIKKAKVQEEASQVSVEQASEAKSGGWHLLNIFDRAADVKKEEAKADREVRQADPVETASAKAPMQQQVAVLETEKGNIAFELYPEHAPQTVANFIELVNSGFYNKYNMKFHRVVPGFVIQTGDPTGTGAGGSKKTIPLEAKNKLSHNAKGIVAMARGFDPNSATSQFYITLTPQTSLDGKYAIFGKVISGLSVLDKIEVGDMLYGVRLVDSSTVTRDPVEKKGFFSSLF